MEQYILLTWQRCTLSNATVKHTTLLVMSSGTLNQITIEWNVPQRQGGLCWEQWCLISTTNLVLSTTLHTLYHHKRGHAGKGLWTACWSSTWYDSRLINTTYWHAGLGLGLVPLVSCGVDINVALALDINQTRRQIDVHLICFREIEYFPYFNTRAVSAHLSVSTTVTASFLVRSPSTLDQNLSLQRYKFQLRPSGK